MRDLSKRDLRPLAIAAAGFSSFLNLYAPQAVLPLMADEYGVSAARAGLTMTSTTLAIALVAPFAGAAADVLGRKRVIVGAMLALLLPTVMLAFAPTLEAMLFWRFAQGLVLPPVFAVIVTYVGEEWPPGEATGVTGIYFSAASVGGFAGRFITGILADWIGWRSAFLVDAGLTVVCAAMVLLLLPRERRFVRASNLTAALRQMLRHLSNPQLLGTFCIGFGVLFNFIAIFTYVNFLLAGPPFSLSAALLGSIFVVYLVGSVLTPMTGRAVARFGRRRLVLGMLAIWASGIALTLAPSLPLIVLGLAMSAGAGFLCQASSTSYVAITAKDGASSAVGLYVTAYYIGGSLGGVLGGLGWALAGWPAVVGIVLAVLTFMASMAAWVWRAEARA